MKINKLMIASMLAGALLAVVSGRVYRTFVPDYSHRLLNPDKVLFVLDQRAVTVSSLDGAAKQKLRRLESELARNLRSEIASVIVASDKKSKAAATTRGRPSKSQVAAEFKRIASFLPSGATLEATEAAIVETLKARQYKMRTIADVERMRNSGRLQIMLTD